MTKQRPTKYPLQHPGSHPAQKYIKQSNGPLGIVRSCVICGYGVSKSKERRPGSSQRAAPRPCGEVDSRSAPDHFPTGPTPTTEAVNSSGT